MPAKASAPTSKNTRAKSKKSTLKNKAPMQDDTKGNTLAQEQITCSCTCSHCSGDLKEQLYSDDDSLNSDLLPHDDTEILAAFFQALANPSRLNIVFVLLKYQQLSVGDIALKTKMSISAVSHQLAILRMRKLVTVRRDGVKNFYALCDDHVSKVIEMAIDHIHED